MFEFFYQRYCDRMTVKDDMRGIECITIYLNIFSIKPVANYFSNVMFDFSYGKDIRIFDLKDFLVEKFTFFIKKE